MESTVGIRKDWRERMEASESLQRRGMSRHAAFAMATKARDPRALSLAGTLMAWMSDVYHISRDAAREITRRHEIDSEIDLQTQMYHIAWEEGLL